MGGGGEWYFPLSFLPPPSLPPPLLLPPFFLLLTRVITYPSVISPILSLDQLRRSEIEEKFTRARLRPALSPLSLSLFFSLSLSLSFLSLYLSISMSFYFLPIIWKVESRRAERRAERELRARSVDTLLRQEKGADRYCTVSERSTGAMRYSTLLRQENGTAR